MNNNVENYGEETFDTMLDSVKSINDEFVNSYFEQESLDSIQDDAKENSEFYDEDSLKDLSNDLTDELFKEELNKENIVEKFDLEDREEILLDETEKQSLWKAEFEKMNDDEIINLIDRADSSDEFFDMLEGKEND